MTNHSSTVRTVAGIIVAVVGFLLGIRILGTATGALAPTLEPLMERTIRGDASALGASWLAAYGLLNGSVVAAVAVSLAHSGLLETSELFAAIVGSRFGASGVVIVLGVVEYVQKPSYSLRESTSLGMLSAIVTLVLFVPVAAVGVAWYRLADGSLRFVDSVPSFATGSWDPTALVAELVVSAGGPQVGFVVAVAALLASFRLFDRTLAAVETGRFRSRVLPVVDGRFRSFLAGTVVTLVTTSVAISVGVLVPLYNRDFFERDELVPYLLGANVGTFGDTVLAAAVLDSDVGVATVVLTMTATTVLSLAVLVSGDWFFTVVGRLEERVRVDRRGYVGFVALLLLVPAVLVLVG
ncbi:sodium:phosphate symporter [Haloarchaeobius baliensis]|uniref:sodium:phosphate symporter n=1 Tax=Haloarchaeobius baliensis TaxID=1670458 RepID=UPI003F8819EE